MRLFIYFFIFILPFQLFSQSDPCKDLSCMIYLLGASPDLSEVKNYLENNKGTIDGASSDQYTPVFNAQLEDLNGQDLISKIEVFDEATARALAKALGFSSDYSDLTASDKSKYPKIKKKQRGVSVPIGWRLETNGSFDDCWRGSIKYRRQADGSLLVNEVSLEFLDWKLKDAIEYNPVGWHASDPKKICETGDCVVCGLGKLGELKGVSVQDRKYDPDIYTIDVAETNIVLPLGISRDVTMEEMTARFGINYPSTPPNIYQVYTEEGSVDFHFTNGKLVKIVSQQFLSCEDLAPKVSRIQETIISGAETADSPGIILYTGGYKYYGERKNGLPHGFGAVTAPGTSNSIDQSSKVFENYFENGRVVGSKPLDQSICLTGNCQKNGTILSANGIYTGGLENGVPSDPKGELQLVYNPEQIRQEGLFEDGEMTKGIIVLSSGYTYEGDVANGKANGNGIMYNQIGKYSEGGWFENGVKTGLHRYKKAETESVYKWNPDKKDWRTYFAQVIIAFQDLNENKKLAFEKTAELFSNNAKSCIAYDVTKTSQLVSCFNSKTSALSSIEQIRDYVNDMWTQMRESTYTMTCKDMETTVAHEYVQGTANEMESLLSNLDLVKTTKDALIEQLKTDVAQKNFGVAKNLYSNGISSISMRMSFLEKNYNDFVQAVTGLGGKLLSSGCNVSR